MIASQLPGNQQSRVYDEPSVPKLKVLIAENVPQNSIDILQSLSELKECNLTSCDNGGRLVEEAARLKPDVLLIDFDTIRKDCLRILNDLRHQNPNAYLIVYLTATLEETRDAVLMAGATECLFVDPENLHSLAGAVKKAIISISERECSDGSFEAVREELPEIRFSLDLAGRCIDVNSAISHLLGYEKDEILNSAFSDLIVSAFQRQKFEDFLGGCPERTSYAGLLTLQTALGIEEDFQVSITLMEGEILCGTAKKIGLGVNPVDWKSEQESERKIEEATLETVDMDLRNSEEALPSHLGPYRVTSILGEGAMGRVYKGFDEHLERHVAIKMINRAFADDAEQLERFKREARLLASISHPNIGLIYYFDVWNNLPFFCMEFLPEGSVDQMLNEKHVLDPQTAILFVQQVALGLKKAQEKGIVHLDIKPSNLMVAEKNRIKIVDFGLAATHGELQENSDTIIGTPAYLAPEQLNDGIIDHRCDIYSLGITFFEMLYGTLPYSGKNVKEIFVKKLTQDLPGPELLNAAVPIQLYYLIRKMVERDPNKRIQQYSELIDQLEEAKRNLSRPALVVPDTQEKSVRLRGNLYDTSFAEVLGNIWNTRLTGRLTLQWLDLNKVIHFKDGIIKAVLSNQEGERFIDLLISEKHLKPIDGLKILTMRSDLFVKYSSAMELVGQEHREGLQVEFEGLAWKILESLFSWAAGEFILEEGDYPEQPNFQIATNEVLAQGIRHHTDFALISRKLLHGKISIVMSTQSANRLRAIRLTASERFLLSKTDGGITFPELHALSNLPREMFGRLLYLFLSMGLVQIEPCEEPVVNKVVGRTAPIVPPPEEEQAAQKMVAEPEPFELEAVQQKTELKNMSTQHMTSVTDQYCRQAAEDFQEGNYWSTVQHCKKALEYKQDFRIYHLMGKALAKHQGFKYDAMKAFKSALSLNPSNVSIQKDIADLYLASENAALAVAVYKKILVNNPRDKHCREKLNEIAHRNDFSKILGQALGKLFGGRKNQASA